MTEDEMVGWHHRLTQHEFQQAPGGGEGQGSLACCSPWGCKELDTIERLNNNNWELRSHMLPGTAGVEGVGEKPKHREQVRNLSKFIRDPHNVNRVCLIVMGCRKRMWPQCQDQKRVIPKVEKCLSKPTSGEEWEEPLQFLQALLRRILRMLKTLIRDPGD